MPEGKTHEAPRSDAHPSSHSTGGFRHTVAQTIGDAFAVQVQAGELSWTLDEPVTMGGHGTAPNVGFQAHRVSEAV